MEARSDNGKIAIMMIHDHHHHLDHLDVVVGGGGDDDVFDGDVDDVNG